MNRAELREVLKREIGLAVFPPVNHPDAFNVLTPEVEGRLGRAADAALDAVAGAEVTPTPQECRVAFKSWAPGRQETFVRGLLDELEYFRVQGVHPPDHEALASRCKAYTARGFERVPLALAADLLRVAVFVRRPVARVKFDFPVWQLRAGCVHAGRIFECERDVPADQFTVAWELVMRRLVSDMVLRLGCEVFRMALP